MLFTKLLIILSLKTLANNKDEYITFFCKRLSKQHNKHDKVAHVNIVWTIVVSLFHVLQGYPKTLITNSQIMLWCLHTCWWLFVENHPGKQPRLIHNSIFCKRLSQQHNKHDFCNYKIAHVNMVWNLIVFCFYFSQGSPKTLFTNNVLLFTKMLMILCWKLLANNQD